MDSPASRASGDPIPAPTDSTSGSSAGSSTEAASPELRDPVAPTGGATPEDPFADELPLGEAQSDGREPEGGAAPEADPATEAEDPLAQPVPLTEAAFLAGVSVQALRQRIKRGTLEGSEALDARGQRVAGVAPTELVRAFPARAAFVQGAIQSKLAAGDPTGGGGVGSAAASAGSLGAGSLSAGSPSVGDGGLQAGRSRVQPAPEDIGRPRHSRDTEADLQNGGMAEPLDRPVVPVRMGPEPGGSAWEISPWSIGLVVALASVAVAGLLTGAREARAANRTLEMTRARETELLETLRRVQDERNAALDELERLGVQFEPRPEAPSGAPADDGS